MVYHLNIGANLGDRRANLVRAVAEISAMAAVVGGEAPVVSAVVESAPWGFESANAFLNVGVNLRLPLDPYALLSRLQAIERAISPAAHRNPDGTYADRVADIDIIAVDPFDPTAPYAQSLPLQSSEHHPSISLFPNLPSSPLILPHPRMHLREFVLVPMAEIWPGWRHPFLRLSPAELLADLRRRSSHAK